MKLTHNFLLAEFESNDGAPTPPQVLTNLQKVANALQTLRMVLNTPIQINSGYRSPAHNARVGGSPNSQHLKGNAADIVALGYMPDFVADTIERLIKEGNMPEGGLGRYDNFTHYDIRGTKARWDNRT